MALGPRQLRVNDRIASLDALRGLTVFAWLLSMVATPMLLLLPRGWVADTLVTQLSPSLWDGFTVYDLILPMFLYVAGASIVPAFRHRHAVGESNRQLALRIVRRLAMLFAIGILCEGGLFHHWPYLRCVGLFQRIALCYAVVAALNVTTHWRFQVAAIAFVLVDYYAMMAFGSSGDAAGMYSFEGNAAAAVDQLLLPGSKYFGTWDSQGILTTLPSIAVTIAGLLAGTALTVPQASSARLTLTLLGVGIVAVNVGILGDVVIPINPCLWTLPFCLIAIGAGSVLLGVFHAALDDRGQIKWASPINALGRNSLCVVLTTLTLSNVVDWVMRLGRPRAPFAESAFLFLAVFAVALFLDRHKIYLTV